MTPCLSLEQDLPRSLPCCLWITITNAAVRGEGEAERLSATHRHRTARCVLGLKPLPRTARVCH